MWFRSITSKKDNLTIESVKKWLSKKDEINKNENGV
jgi:hypothetical protein